MSRAGQREISREMRLAKETRVSNNRTNIKNSDNRRRLTCIEFLILSLSLSLSSSILDFPLFSIVLTPLIAITQFAPLVIPSHTLGLTQSRRSRVREVDLSPNLRLTANVPLVASRQINPNDDRNVERYTALARLKARLEFTSENRRNATRIFS